MNKQHKWHKEIKAWADGAEIEWANAFEPIGYWKHCENPDWDNEHIEYRIKPQPKEPQYLYVYKTKKGIEFEKQYYAYTTDLYIGKIKLEQDDE